MDRFFSRREIPPNNPLEKYTPSPNLVSRSSMLSSQMDLIFDRLVARCFKELQNYAFVRPLKGDARTKHGDYVCLSVLEACEEIRNSDPYLFDKKSPRAIAEKIMGGIRNQNGIFNMINQRSIRVHDAGMITFRLDGSWIAHRIDEMLINGIDTWAPKLYDRKTRAIVVSSDPSETHLLIDLVKPVLVDILLYSGIDVIVSPNLGVADLQYIRSGIFDYKADIMIYVEPHLMRKYYDLVFLDARSQEWFPAHLEPTLACCGCRSLSSDQVRNLSQIFNVLWMQKFEKLENGFEFFSGMAKDSGYDPAQFFYGLIKYTLLKKYRLAEVTLSMESMEEMFDIDGNTLVNILRTKAIISNIIKNSISPGKLSESEKALAGKERELGLQLVEFTGVVEKACRNFVPHLLCEYLFDLSKLFMSYHLAIGKASVKLCRATEVVISQCFQLLGINPSQLNPVRLSSSSPYPFEVRRNPNAHRFSRSRFELFTMRVFVAHPAFDKGSIFGKIWVNDENLARSDWTMALDDHCYVSYFDHEWHQPLNITYGSLIPFGDPSCRRSVPISDPLKVHVLLHAMSDDKQHCYLLFHGRNDEIRSRKWYDTEQDAECPEAECGTMELESRVGTVLINYILLKNAVDALMELQFWSRKRNVCVKIHGSIIAYYGDDLIKDGDILGRYKTVIFRTTNFKSTEMKGALPLHRSLLAVPANGCLTIKANLVDVTSGKKYVREESYRAAPGKDDNLLIECKYFSINLKVSWRE